MHGDVSRVPLRPLLQSWDIVLLAALLSLFNYALRILRWRGYLARLGHPIARRYAALTYTAGFAYTLSPAKVGEMMRARYYVPLAVPPATVTAAFLSERLLDLLVVATLATLLATSFSSYAGALVAGLILVAVALAAVALIPWAAIASTIGRIAGIPQAVRTLLMSAASAFTTTKVLLRPRMLAWGFGIGLLAWGLEGVGLYLLSSIYSPGHLTLESALGIYGTAVLVGGLSFLPGGLGSTEAVMTALLVANKYEVSQALVVTLICRLATLWLACCLGWIAVLLLGQVSLTKELSWR